MSALRVLASDDRFQQQQADEARLHRLGCQATRLVAAPAAVDSPLGEYGPVRANTVLDVVRLKVGAVFDTIGRRVGLRPLDAHRIDGYRCLEVDDHPLRVSLVVLPGEVPVEVGVGLPEACIVPVVQAGETVVVGLIDARPAPRQPVAVGDLDGAARGGVGCPVAGAAVGAAEAPRGVPVPGLHRELGAQPIAEGPKADTLHAG